jgi:hypothetical protein
LYGNEAVATRTRAYAPDVQAACDKPSRPVDSGLDRVGHMAQELAEALSHLERRLESVLTPSGPQSEKSGVNGPRPMRSPHADRLESAADGLASLVGRVNDLVGRLEV